MKALVVLCVLMLGRAAFAQNQVRMDSGLQDGGLQANYDGENQHLQTLVLPDVCIGQYDVNHPSENAGSAAILLDNDACPV